MVIAKAEPKVEVTRNGSAAVATVPSPITTLDRRLACPRCETPLMYGYFEPQCPECGYVYYDYKPPTNGHKKDNIVSSGSRFVLRYVGDAPALSETLAHVKLVRLRNRAVYNVRCPFCTCTMVQSSLSGKRRERREERYKCDEGHRVSLMPSNNNGVMGWK